MSVYIEEPEQWDLQTSAEDAQFWIKRMCELSPELLLAEARPLTDGAEPAY